MSTLFVSCCPGLSCPPLSSIQLGTWEDLTVEKKRRTVRRVASDVAMVAAFLAALPIAFLLFLGLMLNDMSILWAIIPHPILAALIVVIMIGVAAAWERDKEL